MSSDEEQETVSPMKRKRGRPSKSEQGSSPPKGKKASDDGMDGIHYACDVCDQVFLHKSNYLRHSERHEAPGGFVCSLCQYPFTTEWDRNKHKRDEHSVYRCRICQAEFPLEADYKEHIRQEHEGRDCEYDMCPKCGQQFKSASQLKVHVESKCGTEKKFNCSKCSALHLTKASLNTHMIDHVDKQSHKCNYCDSSFASKDQLTVHERMHTDPKPYKCNKCDKAFARRDNLITHFLTHSGTKPYSCSYCDDRFSCIGNLLKHRRARPDTCGLPQHCVTKKPVVPQPSITKTMSSLSNRPVYSNKVVKRLEPQKACKSETPDVSQDKKPVITKKPMGQKTAVSSVKPPLDKKPNISKVKLEVKRERKKSESQQKKMVVLKVVKSDSEMNGDDSDQSAEQDMVEICEIKIEEDGTISEQQQGEVDDGSQEILFESVIEPDGTMHLSTDTKHAAESDGCSNDDDYPDQDESEDYQPPPKYDAKGIRRTFSEKPPVITDVRSRGRKKTIKPEKPKSANIVHIESNCGTEKKHKCSECNSLYLTQASLNAHMIKHVGEKRHLCDYCGTSFLNKGQLKVHERMHTGEKPYKCNQCDKAFAHRESLITHSTTHSGIKPYYCSFCESRFSCIGNLLKHRRARPDTCGLPQHCLTNKIVARPNIKTMPNLTDRSVYTSKVVQRSGPPRHRLPKFIKDILNEESADTKKSLGRKPTKPKKPVLEEVDSNSESDEESLDEMKPNISSINVQAQQRKKSDSRQTLVDLKVEHDHSNDEMHDNKSIAKVEYVEQLENIEVVEIKVEEDDSFIEENTFNMVEDVSQEILYETIIEPDEIVDLPEEPDAESDDERVLEEYDSPDYQPQPRYDEKGIRRTFSEKPPVITEKRRRGRPRKIPLPKPESENIIVLDLEERQRELDAQRAIFEDNVYTLSVDCYRCVHCPMQYSSSYLVGRHLEKDHQIALKELLKTLQYDRVFTRERKYLCRYCERPYANEKALEKHVLLHGPDGKLIHKCSCCTTHFETEEEARQHAMEEHRERLQCTMCDKLFKEPESLAGHVKQYHKGHKYSKKSYYVCPQCGKAFASRTAVSDHERSQCGQNPFYQCEICQKCFHSSPSLKNHYTLHTKELPFSCQYCGKSYRTKGQVKVHERQHTGEKPFICGFCPKTFAHRESWQTHRSTHTGVKRFMCSGCGQRFTCVSNLQAHKRSHKDTCATVPNVSRVRGPDGYHDLPDGYILPFPKSDVVE